MISTFIILWTYCNYTRISIIWFESMWLREIVPSYHKQFPSWMDGNKYATSFWYDLVETKIWLSHKNHIVWHYYSLKKNRSKTNDLQLIWNDYLNKVFDCCTKVWWFYIWCVAWNDTTTWYYNNYHNNIVLTKYELLRVRCHRDTQD